ncbi:hypothetical protein E6O75_ATG03054 [Venturia nashicola]|uniref:Uncharacterized protein n=1 Tax=Venturia nashicola TaxID=86259 RepID=A0A4Z1P6P1_9PEZI|nr:hypothetical protein E6O75_ATG03054 [Venturia nashicola]
MRFLIVLAPGHGHLKTFCDVAGKFDFSHDFHHPLTDHKAPRKYQYTNIPGIAMDEGKAILWYLKIQLTKTCWMKNFINLKPIEDRQTSYPKLCEPDLLKPVYKVIIPINLHIGESKCQIAPEVIFDKSDTSNHQILIHDVPLRINLKYFTNPTSSSYSLYQIHPIKMRTSILALNCLLTSFFSLSTAQCADGRPACLTPAGGKTESGIVCINIGEVRGNNSPYLEAGFFSWSGKLDERCKVGAMVKREDTAGCGNFIPGRGGACSYGCYNDPNDAQNPKCCAVDSENSIPDCAKAHPKPVRMRR